MIDELPILDQIRDAPDNRARGRILLRLPDAVAMREADELRAIFRKCGFRRGDLYLAVRVAANAAIRRKNGALPAQFDEARAAFAAWVNGEAAP